MAVLLAEETKVIDKLDGLLTLKGLRLIYERNKA
jgi:type III pantothenate kinase